MIPSRSTLALVTVILGALACNLPSAADESEGPSETAIAGTVAARVSQTAAPPTATSAPEATAPPAASATPPAPEVSATVVDTATPSVPIVSVSVNTNCRTGPGRRYDFRGALLVGETEEVVALSTVPNYWYITNPDRPGEFCYLWGEYATVAGNTEALPAFTPLPSPTATNTPTPSSTPTPSLTPTPTPT